MKLLNCSIWLLAACTLFGQQFEVASVKVLADASGGGGSHTTGMPPPLTDPGRVDFPDVSLTGVLARAYNVKPLQIEGPEWLRVNRYSIAAKVPKDAPMDQIPAMLQHLLADRFGMTLHWQNKEEQGFALVVAPSGSKLTKSAVSEEDAPQQRSAGMTSNGHLTWRAATLDDVATTLTILLGHPVADQTGLQGRFDLALDAAPDSLPGILSGSGTAAVESPHPSIFDAVKSLGLTLQAGKVTTRRLVVDSAKKIPTEN
jgi:uncharacterized protein (TIGR03435 family)